MPLEPTSRQHAAQIQAGAVGRQRGHWFERMIAQQINNLKMPFRPLDLGLGCLFRGSPGPLLLSYVIRDLALCELQSARALSAGQLATSEHGAKELEVDGVQVTRCKSDVILLLHAGGKKYVKGASTKQCSNRSPTNAQLYFSTATALCDLLRTNGIEVSHPAVNAMRMFCGDNGFRPQDLKQPDPDRRCDPTHWFWEELPKTARRELETTFAQHQDKITRLLLQKAYLGDPFPPDYLAHYTRQVSSGPPEVAIFSIEQFIRLSHEFGSFHTRPYRVKKGSHKDPPGVEHLAPRFGVVQFQRGGQKQHPTQLQFNLKAGYFYQPPFSPEKAEAV